MMRYLSSLLMLLYCLGALAQEPRGAEWLGKPDPEEVEAPALFAEVVTPITIRPGETPLAENQRRVIVHARPVWRVDDAGALAPISTAVESGIESLRQVWRADANTVRFRVTDEGVCVYRAGGHVLRAKPIKQQAEATDGTTLADADQAAPSGTTLDGSKILQVGSFSGVRFEHQVEPGSVKEIAWIDAAPAGIATARWYVLAYRWDSDTLTPSIVNGDVLWKTAKGKTIFRWPAPDVTDATGKALRANYRIRVANPNVIAVLVNATDLRAAAYPVALDPTTTTGSGSATASRNRASNIISGSFREYESCYMLITLPDMTGNTVTAAELQLWATNVDTPTLDIYACKNATTWDATSNLTTMNSVRTGMGTAVITGRNTWSTGAWNYLDVTGDSSKGVTKIYNDASNPGACTFSLRWPTSGRTMTTTLVNVRVGDFNAGPLIEFAAYNDATHYPRVAITYTTAGGSNGSFFFGSN